MHRAVCTVQATQFDKLHSARIYMSVRGLGARFVYEAQQSKSGPLLELKFNDQTVCVSHYLSHLLWHKTSCYHILQ